MGFWLDKKIAGDFLDYYQKGISLWLVITSTEGINIVSPGDSLALR